MNALRKTEDEYSGRNFEKNISVIHILNGVEEFTLDQDGYIIGSNLEAVHLTGYEEYEVMGRHLSIFYPPEDRQKANADIVKASSAGEVVVSGLMVKKHGLAFWAKMEIRSIHVSPADSCAYRVLLSDATHRTSVGKQVPLLTGELSQFNNSFAGTFRLSMVDCSIQICNQKTLAILGAPDSGNLFMEHFFSSLDQFEFFYTSLIEEKVVENFKFQIHNRENREPRWASISARCVENGGFADCMLLDVTEQHEQVMELKRGNTNLQNFIYHASHDLRSPLTSILGLLQLGMNNPSPSDIQKYLTLIQNRVENLDTLLKDLLSISYNDRAAEKIEEFHFEDELSGILDLLISPHQIVKVVTKVHQSIIFRTDAVRMRTVLRNLISNALKYYNPLRSNPSVHIDIRVNSTHCAIQIKDNGIGIAQEYKARVYDMFFRATEKSSGSGLGLYIVKSMIDKLNGQISFESTINVGTTFLLTIPNQA